MFNEPSYRNLHVQTKQSPLVQSQFYFMPFHTAEHISVGSFLIAHSISKPGLIMSIFQRAETVGTLLTNYDAINENKQNEREILQWRLLTKNTQQVSKSGTEFQNRKEM